MNAIDISRDGINGAPVAQSIDHLSLYRLPWNYADNGISWLEPTTKCNLRCEGCYRDLESPVHKSLQEARAELELFKRLRKSDCISIAGGDPLVYPDILPLVTMIKEMGWKPIVNTNGVALTPALLRDLKKAGVYGFTFHIDTSQNRPHAKGWSETQLNAVRLQFAKMVSEAGGLACSFNATVSETTLHEVPAMVEWAREHATIVQTMVFIMFRSPSLSGAPDLHATGCNTGMEDIYKESEWGGAKAVFAEDAAAYIRAADSAYAPSAYLNGTASPDSIKWLMANRVVLNGEVMGYTSPRFMELIQTFAHLFTGTYLAYADQRSTSFGKFAVFAAGLVDKKMRVLAGRLLASMARNPANIFRAAHMQSIMVIQPVNVEPDGTADMCDSCPDMTVHEGKLVWSCRSEELKQRGAFLTPQTPH